VLGRGEREIAHDVQGVPAARGPARHDRDHRFRQEPDQPLDLEDVQPAGPRGVDRVGGLAARVLIPGASANTLVTTGAERPPAVLGRRAVAGEQDTADVGAHPGVVERPVKLVDGVRAEGVADLRAVERDAHDALAAAALSGAVVGDVGEGETFDLGPRGGVEQLGNSGVIHVWENRTCGHL
jgi:hypothetical protein